jgi:hypothetical protein
MYISKGDVDLTDCFDVFVITNGRASFEYVIKSLEEQKNVKFNLHIIRDMKWIDACNSCLKHSSLPFYLRLDDDMILHPMAIHYYYHVLKQGIASNVVVYGSILWEPWNKRVCNIAKLYNRDLTSKVGFEVDSRGKVDKIFRKKSAKIGFKILKDSSVVGIHAACSFDDNYRYSQLRGEINDPTFKIRHKEIIYLDKILNKTPLNKQLEMANKDLYKFNKKNNTLFAKFIG